jgi:rhamnose transport system permease protein
MIGALLGALMINLLQQSLLRWLVISNFWVGALLGVLILISVTIDAVIIYRLRNIWTQRGLEGNPTDEKKLTNKKESQDA